MPLDVDAVFIEKSLKELNKILFTADHGERKAEADFIIDVLEQARLQFTPDREPIFKPSEPEDEDFVWVQITPWFSQKIPKADYEAHFNETEKDSIVFLED